MWYHGAVGRWPRIAVILVYHHASAKQDLPGCYASLLAQTAPPFTLFIVDQASTIETRQWIAGAAPMARIVPSARNEGWGAGNNQALRLALAEGFEQAVLLNVDTRVEAGWLQELVQMAVAREDWQIVQSLLLGFRTATVQSAGNRLHYLGYGYCEGVGPISRCRRADFASGAAMLVKREVFDAIGLFRDDYFLYYDDAEFCWRARLAGYGIGVAVQSVCYHRDDAGKAWRFLYNLERNRLTTLLTLARWRTVCLLFPCLVVAQLVSWGYFVYQGQGRVGVQLLRHFLRGTTWRELLRRRRRIQRLRKVRDAEIVGQFAGRLGFVGVRSRLLQYLVNPMLQGYWGVTRRLIVW